MDISKNLPKQADSKHGLISFKVDLKNMYIAQATDIFLDLKRDKNRLIAIAIITRTNTRTTPIFKNTFYLKDLSLSLDVYIHKC